MISQSRHGKGSDRILGIPMRSVLRNRWLLLILLLAAAGFAVSQSSLLRGALSPSGRFYHFTPQESEAGITVAKGKYTVMSCAGRGTFPVFADALSAASESLSVLAYQYPRQKSVSGSFAYSEKKMQEEPALRSANTLTQFARGTRYHVFSVERDLTFKCGEGLDLPNICGDGVPGGNEQCDDGGTQSGDGCSATCGIEHGYVCEGLPSSCRLTECANGIDEDDDGGIDVPGSFTVVQQDPGTTRISHVLPPMAIDNGWYYTVFTLANSTSTALGVWNVQSGTMERHLTNAYGTRAGYHAGTNMLYLAGSHSNVPLFRVRLDGLQTSLEGTYAGPAELVFYGLHLTPSGDKFHALFQSQKTNPALRGPALLQEVDTATMQKTRELPIADLSGIDGMQTMVFDDQRQKLYILDQRNGAAGTTDQHSLQIREVDLVAMTETGRQFIITGEKMSDWEFDPERGLLFILHNPKDLSSTILHTFSVDSFTSAGTLTLHDGSSVEFEGESYTKMPTQLQFARSDTRRLIATAYYEAPPTSQGFAPKWSRSFFVTIDTTLAPSLVEQWIDVPEFRTSGNPSPHQVMAIDSIRGVVYLQPNSAMVQNPVWLAIAPERHYVQSITSQALFGTATHIAVPVDWEPSRPLSLDAGSEKVLLLPGLDAGGRFHVWPLLRVNAGDLDCVDATDDSEA